MVETIEPGHKRRVFMLETIEPGHRLSLRKQAYSNILKISPPKNENFQIKSSDIFHIFAQNIDCGTR